MSNWTLDDWTKFLTALGTFISIVLSALAAFMATLAKIRGDTNTTKIDQNTAITQAGATAIVNHAQKSAIADSLLSKKIDDIHTATDGMKDELVKVTGEAERAKGKLEGAAEQRDEFGK